MNVQELTQLIEQRHDEYDSAEIARLCLVLLNSVDNLDALRDEGRLREACRSASLRLQASIDQHAAMTLELEELASSDPRAFQSEQIWVLVRAIKVQSQILQMYLGGSPLDV